MAEVTSATTYTVPVPRDKGGTRLDRLIADAVAEVSRTRVKALIEAGRVMLTAPDAAAGGGAPSAVRDPDYRVRAGQRFAVQVPAPAPAAPKAQAMELAIAYEDDHVVVVDKPAGLVVHPAAGNRDRTLVNALLAHCADGLSGIGGVSRPGIVHRLDKDTSGLMVVAKTEAAHRGLAVRFADHTIERAYYAVVWGVPAPRRGEIVGAIGRSSANRKKMAVVGRGKPALTRYAVARAFGTLASLVECRLATGRTHQIRVHMASRGHPVIGDALYGGAARRAPSRGKVTKQASTALSRQALHAFLIGFDHPISGKPLRFESPLPQDISGLLDILDAIQFLPIPE